MSLERIADIIRIAGQSRSGFFALLLVFLSGVLIVMFDRAPPFVRLVAFCGLVFGIAVFCYAVYQAALLPPGAALPS